MRKTFTAAAALAALLGLFRRKLAFNRNGTSLDGQVQGKSIMNGINLNGMVMNGLWLNAYVRNGLNLNGTTDAAATILLQGITLPGGATLNGLAH